MTAIMNSRKTIFILFGLLTLALALLASGCSSPFGDGKTTATSGIPGCDPDGPSIIPATQGRPQLVEFFRDT